MRQLIFFLLILSAGLAQAQTTTSTQYLGAPKTLVRNRGSFQVDSLGSVSDTSAYKAVVATADGLFRRMSRWPAGMGGGYNPADTLLIRRDSIFIFTSDTVYYIGTVDPTLYNKVDSVTFGPSQYVDTVKYWVNGTPNVAGYINKTQGCETGSVGGQVVWNSGLNFDISAAPFYSINCQRYTSEGGSVTLSAADATYGRYDNMLFDTNGNPVVQEGTPSETPFPPTYDPTLYWYRTTVFIPAGATEPQGISDELIYDENVEWATATGGTITADFENTTFEVQGSVSTLVSARSNGSYLQYTSTDTLNVNNYQNLSFWLRLVGSMTNQQNISVQFLLGNTAISNAVVATVTKNNTTGWQLIALNMGQFSFTAFNFNRVRIIFSGNSSSSLYIDVVKLQTGISSGGGGGTVTDAYQKMTDGTNTATATGNGIFKIRSANNVISVVVANDDPTHGDNVLLTFNRNNIDSLQFNQVTGLVDSLNKLQTKLEDWKSSNDSFYVKLNGEWQFRYYNRAFYTNNFQGIGTEESPIDLNPTPSSATPDSVLSIVGGVLYQHPAPTGGGSTPTWQQTLTAGSTLTGTNTINSGGYTQTWNNGQLTLGGTGTTSASYGLQVHNSTGSSNSLVVRDDAKVGVGTASPTGLFTVQANSLGTSPGVNSGVVLENTTAAALGAQQSSPAFTQYGRVWRTADNTSQSVGYRRYVSTSQGSVGFPQLNWDRIDATGATTNEMALFVGALTVAGTYTNTATSGTNIFNAPLQFANSTTGRYIQFGSGSGRSIIGSPSSRNMEFRVNEALSLTTGTLAMQLQFTTGNALFGTATESEDAQLKVESTMPKGVLLARITSAQKSLINLTVTSITITNGGTGYTSNPTVTFSSAPAGGITAVAGGVTRVGNVITAIAVTTAGSYNAAPTITITGGGGSGATATANMTQVLSTGLEIYCTDCTATDGSTGVKQVWNGTTWKNCW